MLDELTFERAGVVALTIGQSAAMEYYERIVDQMFTETDRLVERLEKAGTMPVFTRKLHKFIGAAIGTRSEVLSVLHLFDKPDAAWDDPDAEKIYEELRAEFDLVDRHQSLELKLRSVQDALELVTDIARDKRLVALEVSIVVLIVVRDRAALHPSLTVTRAAESVGARQQQRALARVAGERRGALELGARLVERGRAWRADRRARSAAGGSPRARGSAVERVDEREARRRARRHRDRDRAVQLDDRRRRDARASAS